MLKQTNKQAIPIEEKKKKKGKQIPSTAQWDFSNFCEEFRCNYEIESNHQLILSGVKLDFWEKAEGKLSRRQNFSNSNIFAFVAICNYSSKMPHANTEFLRTGKKTLITHVCNNLPNTSFGFWARKCACQPKRIMWLKLPVWQPH